MIFHSQQEYPDKPRVEIGEWAPPIIEKKISNNNIFVELFGYIGATGACNIKLYSDFGPIVFMKAYEDQVLCARASLTKNSIIYIDQPLVKYRVGSGITTKAQELDISFEEILRNRKLQIEVYVDIYKQRLLDLEKTSNRKCYSKFKIDLEAKLRLQELRLMLYNEKPLFAKNIFSKDFQVASKAFILECWELTLRLKEKYRRNLHLNRIPRAE